MADLLCLLCNSRLIRRRVAYYNMEDTNFGDFCIPHVYAYAHIYYIEDEGAATSEFRHASARQE